MRGQRQHMSTQALLDELAARERRVIEQLNDLSGINQSPIPTQQAYASLQATPRDSLTPPPARPRRADPGNEASVKASPAASRVARSRNSVDALEHDLQRLQFLLRHSPLHEDVAPTDDPQIENKWARDVYTPALQRYASQPEVEAVAGGEKRTRVSPVAHLSTSPVAPEMKRDKRETLVYAPPPPLHPLPTRGTSPRHRGRGTSVSATHNGRGENEDFRDEGERTASLDLASDAVDARRSTVLDMRDYDDDVDEEEKKVYKVADFHVDASPGDRKTTDGVRSLRECSAPLSSTSMFSRPRGGGLQGDGRSVARSFSQAAKKANSNEETSDRVALEGEDVGWRRSPVRWVAASPADARVPAMFQANTEASNNSILCTSAAEAWDAHRSPPPSLQSKPAPGGPPLNRPISSTLSTPPPIFVLRNEASQLDMEPSSLLSAASPPPRFPGTPSPLPKVALQATVETARAGAIPTPNPAERLASSPVRHAHQVPRTAETPQPTAKAHGLFATGSAGVSTGAAPPRRAMSVLPRGVTHPTSWRGLRAYFARQSRVAALLTPALPSVEERASQDQ